MSGSCAPSRRMQGPDHATLRHSRILWFGRIGAGQGLCLLIAGDRPVAPAGRESRRAAFRPALPGRAARHARLQWRGPPPPASTAWRRCLGSGGLGLDHPQEGTDGGAGDDPGHDPGDRQKEGAWPPTNARPAGRLRHGPWLASALIAPRGSATGAAAWLDKRGFPAQPCGPWPASNPALPRVR